jgi:hypothetical protein
MPFARLRAPSPATAPLSPFCPAPSAARVPRGAYALVKDRGRAHPAGAQRERRHSVAKAASRWYAAGGVPTTNGELSRGCLTGDG